MQPPTSSELLTAIEVLRKLGERIQTKATHLAIRLPETRLGTYHARRTEAQAIEQIGYIETIAAHLENWRNELNEPKGK